MLCVLLFCVFISEHDHHFPETYSDVLDIEGGKKHKLTPLLPKPSSLHQNIGFTTALFSCY